MNNDGFQRALCKVEAFREINKNNCCCCFGPTGPTDTYDYFF